MRKLTPRLVVLLLAVFAVSAGQTCDVTLDLAGGTYPLPAGPFGFTTSPLSSAGFVVFPVYPTPNHNPPVFLGAIGAQTAQGSTSQNPSAPVIPPAP